MVLADILVGYHLISCYLLDTIEKGPLDDAKKKPKMLSCNILFHVLHICDAIGLFRVNYPLSTQPVFCA